MFLDPVLGQTKSAFAQMSKHFQMFKHFECLTNTMNSRKPYRANQKVAKF